MVIIVPTEMGAREERIKTRRRTSRKKKCWRLAKLLKRNWEEKRVLNSNYIINDLRKLRFKQFQLSALAGEPH